MKKKILILILLLLSFSFLNFMEVKADTNLTCLERKEGQTTCENPNHGYACVWNETKYGNYCNTDNLMYISCGDASDIPYQAPGLISFAVNLLKIATPIILIIISIISLLKALASSNEDEIKKSQKSLIRKLIAAAMVFFIISIVQFVIMKVADDSEITNISDCLSCFLNNDCEENVYYKTNIASTYYCTPLSTGVTSECETFDINDKSIYAVNNDFYKGPKAESCNGEYYWDDYIPGSIMYNGTCYEVMGTEGRGIDYVVVEKTLAGETRPLNLEENEIHFVKIEVEGELHYFYWSYSKNEFIEFDPDNSVITPHYTGDKIESCNGKYFSNGYQPKSISINGTCHELKANGDKVYVNGNSIQTVWKIDNQDKCYYWKGSENKYINIPCDRVYTEYYQGTKQTSCQSKGYFSNGYQPKAVKINGKCHELQDTGNAKSFETVNLIGEPKIVTQTIWQAKNKCYYWEGRENQYKEIICQ